MSGGTMSSETISATRVRELREKTGVGMMDCKKALAASGGDMEAAIEHLRKQGVASAAKRSGRETREGQVYAYIHPGGRVGVMIEIGCETDFVARTDDFQNFCREMAMQVAATDAVAVDRDGLAAHRVEEELAIFRAQVEAMGKPAQVTDKIVEGKMEKFYSDVVLLEQAYIRDPERKVRDLLTATIAKLGENITVRRFTKYRLGEE